jgi:hypothetical protein
MWTPSMSRPTRSSASRAAVCHAANCAAVVATTRRLTALLLVPRLVTVAGTGSKLRAYRRVATPTSICSATRRFNGSSSAMAWNVGRATSWPPPRTRGRRTVTFRPPSTTAFGTMPARTAWRLATCAYRGPQMAARSSSSIVSKTFKPDRMARSNSSLRASTSRSTRGEVTSRFNRGVRHSPRVWSPLV